MLVEAVQDPYGELGKGTHMKTSCPLCDSNIQPIHDKIGLSQKQKSLAIYVKHAIIFLIAHRIGTSAGLEDVNVLMLALMSSIAF